MVEEQSIEARAQQLVETGRFTDVEEVLQAGLDALEDEQTWKAYAEERIQAGLDDVSAGRIISGDDFLAQLREGRLKHA